MGVAKNNQQQSLQGNRFLKRVLILSFVINLLLAIGYLRLPKMIKVHTAPDVTKSFVQKADEIPLHAVYGFARVLWQSLNYCEEDCGKEYLETLKKYRSYLTKTCQHSLTTHFNTTRNLYDFRSRLLLPVEDTMFSNEKIQQLSNNVWYVKLKYNLKDDVRGHPTRDNIMLYPIKVIRSDKPLSINPLGMEIDCFFGDGPLVIERRIIKQQ